MSSHHVVRDEQEPALIVSDFTQSQREDIGQLLEWSPTVIGLESSLHDLQTLGINIDIAVIAPNEVAHWQDVLQYQQPIKFFTVEGDSVHMIAAIINHLLQENYKTFHILSNVMNLFDFINLHQNFKFKAELVYINEAQKISIFQAGKFRKWLRAGDGLSVFPIEEPTYIRTDGFVSNIDNEIIQLETYFEAAEEGVVSIETNLKPIIIAESL